MRRDRMFRDGLRGGRAGVDAAGGWEERGEAEGTTAADKGLEY